MADRAEQAVEKFQEGYNCAQAVVHGFADRLGGEAGALFRTASVFGAGMGRRQEVCGAVSGAALVIGALVGRGDGEDRERTETAYRLVAGLQRRFADAHGSVVCRDLLDGYDLGTAAGQEAFKADNRIADCHGFVASACRILEEVLVRG